MGTVTSTTGPYRTQLPSELPCLRNPMAHLHNVLSRFSELRGVPYIEDYLTRAAIACGLAAVAATTPDAYLGRQRELGIGAKDIIRVHDPHNVYGGLTDEDLRLIRERYLEIDHPLAFFSPTHLEADFLRRIGANWRNTWGTTANLATAFNDKVIFTETVIAAGGGRYLPTTRIVDASDTAAGMQAVGELHARYSRVLVKAGNLASGDGIYPVDRGTAWRRTAKRALKKLKRRLPGQKILVQEFFAGIEASGQVQITDAGPRFLYITANHTNGGVHVGNTITSGLLHGLTAEMQAVFIEACMALATILYHEGVRGYMGFDGTIGEEDGQLKAKIFDPNIRVTGAFYVASLAAQISRSRSEWAVRSCVLAPARRLGYHGTVELFDKEDIGYTGDSGLHVICPTMAEGGDPEMPNGKVMVFAVGDTEATVDRLIREGAVLLGDATYID